MTDAEKAAEAAAKELNDLKTANADMKSRLEKFEAKDKEKPDDKDVELDEKARKLREATDKSSNDTKALEAAVRFNMGAAEWLKTNQALLPKEINDIFKAADGEKFDSAVQKDAAIKAGIVKSFFSVQANLDLLTPSLKNQLEDYLKLSKTGKEEKAQAMYDAIFEPTFEMLKRVRKAEAIQQGKGDGSDEAYKNRLINASKSHYLGEKNQ